MPTLAEVAGIEAPEQTDGISFLPTVLGKQQKKHDHLYWEIAESNSAKAFRQATRRGDWKAVRYGQHADVELYYLKDDLYETNDVAKKYPEIAERMEKILNAETTKSVNYPYAGGGGK